VRFTHEEIGPLRKIQLADAQPGFLTIHQIFAISAQWLHARPRSCTYQPRQPPTRCTVHPGSTSRPTIEEHAMKRILAAAGSLGLVALLGITLVSQTVGAQTATPESTSKKDQFLSTLAGKLGVSTDTLQTAIEQTTDELGFGPARFAERLRERIQDRVQLHRDRLLDHMDLSQGAAFIGITEEQLKTELEHGDGFIAIARAHGKTDDQIRAFLIQRATEKIDQRLHSPSGDATAPASA
jgi:hypothetical protein